MSSNNWVPSQLPSGWAAPRLDTLCEVVRGGSPRPMGDPRYFGGTIPFVKIADVTRSDGRILLETETKVTIDGASRSRLIPAGRLILTNSATVCVPVFLGVDACIHDGFVAFEGLADFVYQEYLYYFFKYIRPYVLDEHKQGVTQVNLNTGIVGEMVLLLPPPREQQLIVAKIEELLSELDIGVESLTTGQARLKAYRQSLLKHAFDGDLTGDVGRSEWRTSCVGQEIDFLTSGSRGWADYYSHQGAIFIRAQDLKHDHLDLDECAFVDIPRTCTEGTRTLVQRGDVLITITGANVTKTGFVDRDIGRAYVSQHVALCRPSASLLPAYLYWYLLSETGGRRQLTKAAYGAGKPGLNLENIRSVSIPVPPIEKQWEIVSIIESGAHAERRLNGILSQELERATILRQAILKRAFSGRLVSQDPNDEAASVLLERIRSDRTMNSTKTTKLKQRTNGEAA